MEFVLIIVVSIVWSCLWVKTFKKITVVGFIVHSVIWSILSLLVLWAAAQIIFLPVDSTYSASNIGALGILNLTFIFFFGAGCIIAFLIDLGRVVISVKNEKQEK